MLAKEKNGHFVGENYFLQFQVKKISTSNPVWGFYHQTGKKCRRDNESYWNLREKNIFVLFFLICLKQVYD